MSIGIKPDLQEAANGMLNRMLNRISTWWNRKSEWRKKDIRTNIRGGVIIALVVYVIILLFIKMIMAENVGVTLNRAIELEKIHKREIIDMQVLKNILLLRKEILELKR